MPIPTSDVGTLTQAVAPYGWIETIQISRLQRVETFREIALQSSEANVSVGLETDWLYVKLQLNLGLVNYFKIDGVDRVRCRPANPALVFGIGPSCSGRILVLLACHRHEALRAVCVELSDDEFLSRTSEGCG